MKKTARTCNCNWNKSLQLLLWILNINLLNAFTKESIAICNIITSEVFLFLFFFEKKKKRIKKKKDSKDKKLKKIIEKEIMEKPRNSIYIERIYFAEN